MRHLTAPAALPLPLLAAFDPVDGSAIVIAAVVILFVALAIGGFTRAGSGINEHPRGPGLGGDAPGASAAPSASGKDEREPPSDRGTR